MKLNFFMKELERALVERGVNEDTAKKHVTNLSRTFTSDDLDEIEAIESPEEIGDLADSIAVILNKKKNATPPVQNALVNSEQPSAQPQPKKAEENTPKKAPVPKQNERLYSEPDDFYFENYNKNTATTRGVTIFWVGLFVSLPITLALLAALFGSFAAALLCLIGIIIGCIAALVGLVAAGAAVSLVGIIYGITQLFSFPAAGIYEIGLGVMVAGAVLFVSILIYNFAIRFIPWVISYLGVFFKYVCGKLKDLFIYVRKECYKL